MVGSDIRAHHRLAQLLFQLAIFVQIIIIHIKYAMAFKAKSESLGYCSFNKKYKIITVVNIRHKK